MNSSYKLAGMALASGIIAMASAQKLTLHPVYSDAMKKVGFYMPHRLDLSPNKPATAKVVPSGLTNPMYGVIKMDGRDYTVLIDETAGGGEKLYIDSNANGNLTDDAPVDWKDTPRKDQAGVEHHFFGGKLLVKLPHFGDGKTPVSLGAYRFDPADPARAALKSTLLYYTDYALDGEAVLDGKTYHALILDPRTAGDFTPSPSAAAPKAPPMYLMLDVNGNGKFDQIGEQYDVSKPFNIHGTTYEVAGFSESGKDLKLKKSSTMVAEVLPPSDLSAGHKVIAFTAKTLDGKSIDFPNTYKGKIVMLDFWATWCGPCMQEVPNVVSVYNKMHDKGFEILGVSLDNKDTMEKIGPVTKDKQMVWDEIADGKFWDAEIAKKYYIQSIPHSYLVDGDTGMVIAEGDEIRGDALLPAVQKALAQKAKGSSGNK